MQKSVEERITSLEAKAEFQLANSLALQTVLIAALQTVNRDVGSKAYFTEKLKAAAAGSYDHALGQAWSDQVIAIQRQGMAAFVGKEIAAAAGLP
ncbi:hypothetical protein [Acidovorax sp. Root217]|uniref:hypothetical protein n=1 Tax=Acidovorax sp. Root217 TaxID=1736492 RepID=UPI000AAC32FA|nr:hypothetical protein [Acidovorax sp. Root217]